MPENKNSDVPDAADDVEKAAQQEARRRKKELDCLGLDEREILSPLREKVRQEFPDLTEAEVDTQVRLRMRIELLQRAYARSLATGDFLLGIRALREDIRIALLALHQKKAGEADNPADGHGIDLTPTEKAAEYRRLLGVDNLEPAPDAP